MKYSRSSVRAEAVREDAVFWPAGKRFPNASALSASFEKVSRACGAFEWITLGYISWLEIATVVFHRSLPHAARYFAIHLCLAIGVVCLAWAATLSTNTLLRFARHWYPLPLYIFFFEELRGLIHMIFPRWFDRWLIDFDYRFAGMHPAIWLARFSSPAMNDFMQFAYMTYFLFLLILPAILYARRDRVAFWAVMVSTAIAHYSVYVIAVLCPVESPNYSLASLHMKALEGGYFTATIDFIERFGRVHGAAFPSAHVAGSMVAMCAAWRYHRWLFWGCLPFFASMCVATVYGRYHYVADVIAGIAVGGLGFILGKLLVEQTGAVPKIAE